MKTILTNIFYLLFSVIISQAAPGAFTLVSATPGCDGSSPNITLTWTAAAGAQSYNIYRNGSIYAQAVSGLTYENVGANVVAGTTYSYYIYAVNSVGATESGNSLSATARTTCGGTAPGAFTLVSATPGCDGSSPNITLTWTAAAGATSYYIYAVNSVGATESGNTLSATAPSNCGTTPQAPTIATQPQTKTVNAGTTVTFSVAASGASLNYQWRFNGQTISSATTSTLTLNSVTAANDGGYSVYVWNAYGSVTSATASLAVLTDGANGNTPTQITPSLIPSKPPGVNNLVFVTHGWEQGLFEPSPPQWVSDMCNDIQTRVPNWQVIPYFWVDKAWTEPLDLFHLESKVMVNAQTIGTQIGQQIAEEGYQHVHLIAHSAGSALIQAAADVIKQNSPSTIVQTTFLDPFVGFDNKGISWRSEEHTSELQ